MNQTSLFSGNNLKVCPEMQERQNVAVHRLGEQSPESSMYDDDLNVSLQFFGKLQGSSSLRFSELSFLPLYTYPNAPQ